MLKKMLTKMRTKSVNAYQNNYKSVHAYQNAYQEAYMLTCRKSTNFDSPFGGIATIHGEYQVTSHVPRLVPRLKTLYLVYLAARYKLIFDPAPLKR